MSQPFIRSLFPDLDKAMTQSSDWTFNGAATRELTHCYHDYPARMIPQVAGKLLDMFAPRAVLLFDPYCGTGTSLVEGLVRGINVVGTDLNPLARLIATAKTSTPDIDKIDKQLTLFGNLIVNPKAITLSALPEIQGIRRLDFWFKPEVIKKLSLLRWFIDEITDDAVRLFFQIAFSETVRESSNTRSAEFKLYRYGVEKLEEHNPDVFSIMSMKLRRNRAGLQRFLTLMQRFTEQPRARVYDFNTVLGVPAKEIAPSTIDIVVTSPPYGDSHTTVAYGQYSRLSAAWLGLSEPDKIDRKLMGGQIAQDLPRFPSDALNEALVLIGDYDEKRAREVGAFYSDLSKSIAHVAPLLKPSGYACYVVGNRKVKGVVLPTDIAIRSFFERYDFDYIDTFHRSIPNKRMPSRNSPTNAAGVVESTMIQEHIVVMRRRK